MKVLLFLGFVLLFHAVYSMIEFHKFNKDLTHGLSLPKDILVQLVTAALITVWFAVPEKKGLAKIRADEFYHDFSYDQGQTSLNFRNFYGSRAVLINKRATANIVKAPSK